MDKKKQLWELVKPPVVLLLICFIMTGLLVFVHDVTYVDTTGVITDKLRSGLESMLGEGESENCVMLTEFQAEGITSVIVDADKSFCALEVTTNGYAKDGIHLLVGVQNDKVIGVYVLSCGETEGLGTRIKEAPFLEQFLGLDSPEFEIDVISGATYSSNGAKSAVEVAMTTYTERKGEIFSGK